MMTAMKEVSPEREAQIMSSLDLANRVRTRRASILHRLNEGKITLAEALEDEYLQTAAIFNVLIRLDRWGRVRVRKLLLHNGIAEMRQVQALTTRQKELLIEKCDASD